jgi:hypothetical protein
MLEQHLTCSYARLRSLCMKNIKHRVLFLHQNYTYYYVTRMRLALDRGVMHLTGHKTSKSNDGTTNPLRLRFKTGMNSPLKRSNHHSAILSYHPDLTIIHLCILRRRIFPEFGTSNTHELEPAFTNDASDVQDILPLVGVSAWRLVNCPSNAHALSSFKHWLIVVVRLPFLRRFCRM